MIISLNLLNQYLKTPNYISKINLPKYLTMLGMETKKIKGNIIIPYNILLTPILKKKVTRIITSYKIKILNKIYNIESTFKTYSVGDIVPYIRYNNHQKMNKKNCIKTTERGFFYPEKNLKIFKPKYSSYRLNNIELNELKKSTNQIKKENIYDADITPNRVDALSHLGIARDIVAKLKINITNKTIDKQRDKFKIKKYIKLLNKNKKTHILYIAKLIKNTKVKPSPLWLKTILISLDVNLKNNIIDGANLITIKTGQLINVFDLDKIQSTGKLKNIIIRNANKKEGFTNINNKHIKLNEKDIVLADSKGAFSLIGVTESKRTQIRDKTKNIIIATSSIEGHALCKSIKRHKVSMGSDISNQKGINYKDILHSLMDASSIISKISNADTCNNSIKIINKSTKCQKIPFNIKGFTNTTGISLNNLNEINIYKNIIKLKIQITKKKDNIIIFKIPKFRYDLNNQIDLTEEILRIIGYNKVPLKIFNSKRIYQPYKINNITHIIKNIKNNLIAKGFCECINLTFLSKIKNKYSPFLKKNKIIKIKNPIHKDNAYMRQSLLPGLIKNLSYNNKQGLNHHSIFEIGKTFVKRKIKKILSLKTNKKKINLFSKEMKSISIITRERNNQNNTLHSKNIFNFYYIKGVFGFLINSIGIKNSLINEKFTYRKPKNNYNLFAIKNTAEILFNIPNKRSTSIGVIGQINNNALKHYCIKESLYGLEIFINPLKKIINYRKIIEEPSKYPDVIRELSLLISINQPIQKLINTIKLYKTNIIWLKKVYINDIYIIDTIKQRGKSITISFIFNDKEKTLKDSEINNMMDKLIFIIQKKIKCQIR